MANAKGDTSTAAKTCLERWEVNHQSILEKLHNTEMQVHGVIKALVGGNGKAVGATMPVIESTLEQPAAKEDLLNVANSLRNGSESSKEQMIFCPRLVGILKSARAEVEIEATETLCLDAAMYYYVSTMDNINTYATRLNDLLTIQLYEGQLEGLLRPIMFDSEDLKEIVSGYQALNNTLFSSNPGLLYGHTRVAFHSLSFEGNFTTIQLSLSFPILQPGNIYQKYEVIQTGFLEENASSCAKYDMPQFLMKIDGGNYIEFDVNACNADRYGLCNLNRMSTSCFTGTSACPCPVVLVDCEDYSFYSDDAGVLVTTSNSIILQINEVQRFELKRGPNDRSVFIPWDSYKVIILGEHYLEPPPIITNHSMIELPIYYSADDNETLFGPFIDIASTSSLQRVINRQNVALSRMKADIDIMVASEYLYRHPTSILLYGIVICFVIYVVVQGCRWAIGSKIAVFIMRRQRMDILV